MDLSSSSAMIYFVYLLKETDNYLKRIYGLAAFQHKDNIGGWLFEFSFISFFKLQQFFCTAFLPGSTYQSRRILNLIILLDDVTRMKEFGFVFHSTSFAMKTSATDDFLGCSCSSSSNPTVYDLYPN